MADATTKNINQMNLEELQAAARTSENNIRKGIEEPPLDAPIEQKQGVSDYDREQIKKYIDENRDPLLVKNYLEAHHPDLDVKLHKGQIIVRKAGEKTPYGVIDPEGWHGWDEAKKDLNDVKYDVLSGLGNTAASIVGLITGGRAGESIGSGLTAGAMEAFKQKKAMELGLRSKPDPTAVAEATTIGLTAPLFGPFLGKVIRNVGSTVAPAIATATGHSADTIRTLFSKYPEIMGMAGNLTNQLQDVKGTVVNTLKDEMSKAGQWFGDKVAGATDLVDTSEARQIIKDHIADLEKRVTDAGAIAAPEAKRILANAKSVYADLFMPAEGASEATLINKAGQAVKTSGATETPQIIDAREAWRKLHGLYNYTEGAIKPNGQVPLSPNIKLSQSEKELNSVLQEAAGNIKDKIDAVAGTSEATDRLKGLTNLQARANPLFRDERSTFSSLKKIAGGDKFHLNLLEDLKKEGIDLSGDAKSMLTYEKFGRVPDTYADLVDKKTANQTIPAAKTMGLAAAATAGMMTKDPYLAGAIGTGAGLATGAALSNTGLRTMANLTDKIASSRYLVPAALRGVYRLAADGIRPNEITDDQLKQYIDESAQGDQTGADSSSAAESPFSQLAGE